MPNVTVLGTAGSVVSIPVTSSAAATAAQTALNLVSAAIASTAVTPLTFAGAGSTTVTGPTELVFGGAAAQGATLPAGSSFVSLVSNATAQTSIFNSATTAATVVSGTGGLTYTQAAPTVSGSLIVAGGGANNISLATGANTVSLDITPTTVATSGLAIGTSTVNALAGGALVTVNSNVNNTTTLDNALVAAAGRDTVVMAGSGAVLLADATNVVSVQAGGAGFFANATSTQAATNIALATGNETVGVLSTSTESVTGSTSGTIYIAGGAGVTGSVFINPNQQNVTVFAGAGSSTLFGAGDAGAGGVAPTGKDIVLGGTGYFHAGSGGGALMTTAASISGPATTLVGGGTGDVLYAQSANTSLLGSAGTAILAASGVTISGGITSLGSVTAPAAAGTVFSVGGAAGGDTLNAGASNAAIFGATSGANTIVSGSGSSTVFGHAGATGGTGNTYIDGAAGGKMSIDDFAASDTFRLTGSQTVSGVTTGTTGAVVTLSDGTTITVTNGIVTASNVSSFFHS